ncbi:MAG: hypothetical protein BroJett003_16310 [Planctomycetota bacterium]|nr:MAG: hypothetical protein BroJett003_16310 [Planctomycetota bacterium]
MTCREFNKFIGAFADGELDTVRNLEALDHLKMCEGCTRRVDQMQALRGALGRQGRAVTAPEALTARVTTLIREPAANPRPVRLRTLLSARPVGIAAGMLLAVLAWTWWTASGDDDTTEATILPGRQVAAVRTVHESCVAGGRIHHDPTLPTDAAGAGHVLGERLNMRVLAPDLTRYGFQFVGAGACDLRGRTAAHLVYQAQATGDYLSIFTVDRSVELSPRDSFVVGGRTYHVEPRDPQLRLCVVSWDRDGQTYVWCAKWCPNSLIQVADCACEDERPCRKTDPAAP